jgi:hypothetical protein
VQNVAASAEICDNLDNDCDGTVDSFATACGLGPCASTGSCVAGANSCVAGTSSAEVCDGADNDCDGAVDDLVGADPDLDGFDSGCDNCPTAYNPDQVNSDLDIDGGDACDITVTFPLAGDIRCPVDPPTITWTPKNFTHFKVFVGLDPNFNSKFTSGKKLLTVTQFTPSTSKWNLACAGVTPNIYIKVRGKIKGQKGSEDSTVVTVPVR